MLLSVLPAATAASEPTAPTIGSIIAKADLDKIEQKLNCMVEFALYHRI